MSNASKKLIFYVLEKYSKPEVVGSRLLQTGAVPLQNYNVSHIRKSQ